MGHAINFQIRENNNLIPLLYDNAGNLRWGQFLTGRQTQSNSWSFTSLPLFHFEHGGRGSSCPENVLHRVLTGTRMLLTPDTVDQALELNEIFYTCQTKHMTKSTWDLGHIGMDQG